MRSKRAMADENDAQLRVLTERIASESLACLGLVVKDRYWSRSGGRVTFGVALGPRRGRGTWDWQRFKGTPDEIIAAMRAKTVARLRELADAAESRARSDAAAIEMARARAEAVASASRAIADEHAETLARYLHRIGEAQ